MSMYDCNGEVTETYEVHDRIEADSEEEADAIFEQNIRAGDYEDFRMYGRMDSYMSWGAKKD